MKTMQAIEAGSISNGRKTLVFGLDWYVVDEGVSPRKAGLELARDIRGKYDLIATRRESAQQFGLTLRSSEVAAGAYSAASTVAEIAQEGSWIYVLEVNSLIWICCGRDGYILPTGDRLFDSPELAKQAFQDLGPSSFKKLYLPASWKVDGAKAGDFTYVADNVEITDLEDFIRCNPPKWGRLARVSSLGPAIRLAVAVALVLAAFFGLWSMFSNDFGGKPDEREIREIRARQIAEAAKEAAIGRKKRWAEYDSFRPWQNEPPAYVLLESCVREIRQTPATSVGYQVGLITCDGNGVTTTVARTTGYTDWLEEWAIMHPGIEISTDGTGDTGYLFRRMSNNGARGAENISAFAIVSDEILRTGQIDGATVDMTLPVARVVQDDPEYIPVFATSAYEIKTRRPEAWNGVIAGTPGITIESVAYEHSEKTFSFKGNLHVKNR